MSSSSSSSELKRALHYAVVQIVEEEGRREHFVSKKETIYALTDVVYRYIDVLAKDLEAFSKHAKRKKITTADVKLMARKDRNLVRHLELFENSLNK